MRRMPPALWNAYPRAAALAAAVALFLGGAWVAADSAGAYLRVRAAPLRAQASLSEGEAAGLLFAGTACQVLERSKDGDWARVSFRDQDGAPERSGWVHATLLDEKPPRLEGQASQAWVKDGAAGLPKDETPGRAAAHAAARKLDLQPILALEAAYPKAEEVEEFLKQGKLGVYRGDWPSLELQAKP